MKSVAVWSAGMVSDGAGESVLSTPGEGVVDSTGRMLPVSGGSVTELPRVTRGMNTEITMITAAMMMARDTMMPTIRSGEGPRP